MKLERKVRLCSAAAAVLIAAIALTGCGGSKTTASSAAASSVAASTAAATNNSCGEGVTWALADGTLTISGPTYRCRYQSDYAHRAYRKSAAGKSDAGWCRRLSE